MLSLPGLFAIPGGGTKIPQTSESKKEKKKSAVLKYLPDRFNSGSWSRSLHLSLTAKLYLHLEDIDTEIPRS